MCLTLQFPEFSKVALPFPTHSRREGVPVAGQHVAVSTLFLVSVSLVDESWGLVLVSVCVSVLAGDPKALFVCIGLSLYFLR